MAAAKKPILRHSASAWVAALACAALACETRFVDPDPPALSQRALQFDPAVAREPVVYGAVLDLFLPDAQSCAQARAFALQALADAVAPLGEAQALEPVDVAPGCAPDPGRRLDAAALDDQVRALEAALPGHAVRPAVIYVSNLELALPDGLRQDLASLQDRAAARGGLAPLLWAASAVPDALFSRHVEWGHALDQGLRDRLAALAAAELPLRSQAPVVSAQLLPADEAQQQLLYKVCAKDGGLSVVNAPDDGTSFAPVLQHPPYVVGRVPELVAVPASSFAPTPLHLLLEACAANCSRYAGQVPGEDAVPWSATPRCLLVGGAP